MATRSSAGVISIRSSPEPCVMKSLICSWNSDSPDWRVSAKLIE